MSDQTENAGTPPDAAQSTANLAAIAADFVTDMPEVQPHAVAQAQAQAQAQAAAPVDKDGVRFDPAVHVTGPDGKGVMTVRKTWAQKRGRKGGDAASRPAQSTMGGLAPAAPAGQATPLQLPADVQAAARAAGIATAELVFVVGRVAGGEEWDPSKAEREMMHQVWGDYFVATGKVDVPPWMGVAIGMTAYAGPRFGQPKTQARVGKLKQWVVSWWTNRKLRRMGLQAEVRATAEKAQ